MQGITIRVEEETVEWLDEQAEERGVSRSEFVRSELVDKVRAKSRRIEELKDEVTELEQTVERLQNEKQVLIEEREEKKELVRYVEDERERRQRRRQAPIWQRAKWWVVGAPG